MTNSISIQTPKGIISANTINSDEYPAIELLVNNEIVAVVEYDSLKKGIQVRTYDETSDEPRDLYVYKELNKYMC